MRRSIRDLDLEILPCKLVKHVEGSCLGITALQKIEGLPSLRCIAHAQLVDPL